MKVENGSAKRTGHDPMISLLDSNSCPDGAIVVTLASKPTEYNFHENHFGVKPSDVSGNVLPRHYHAHKRQHFG